MTDASSNMSPSYFAETAGQLCAVATGHDIEAKKAKLAFAITWNNADDAGKLALSKTFRDAYLKAIKRKEAALCIVYASPGDAARSALNAVKALAKEARESGIVNTDQFYDFQAAKVAAKADRKNAEGDKPKAAKAAKANGGEGEAITPVGEHGVPADAPVPQVTDELFAAFVACRRLLGAAKVEFPNGGDKARFEAQWALLARHMAKFGQVD
jgi:hypothetical protein